MLTCSTLARGMLRCLPLEDRHMSCVSASARRKKCILGLPSRPCFSRSVPCMHAYGMNMEEISYCSYRGAGSGSSPSLLAAAVGRYSNKWSSEACMGQAGRFTRVGMNSSAWTDCALTHGRIPGLSANKKARQATFLSAVSSSSGVRLPAPVALSLSVYLWMRAGPPDALMLASLLLMRTSG